MVKQQDAEGTRGSPEAPDTELCPIRHSGSCYQESSNENSDCAATTAIDLLAGAGQANNNSARRTASACSIIPLMTTWSLEISILMAASSLFVAICLVLNMYQGKELPNWGGTITLNTLVSVPSTVLRSGIALVAFEVLSQLKWDWVSARARPMRDLQLFDDASRGVFGSLKLVPLAVTHSPLAMGAIFAAVVSIAIGPFVQQTMHTYQCRRPVDANRTGHASIAIANRVDSEKLWYQATSINAILSIGMQSAIQDSIVKPSQSSNIAALFECETGDCTFPAYADSNGGNEISHASLAMCSRCEDTHGLVEGPLVEPLSGDVTFRLPVPVREDEDGVRVMIGGDGRREVRMGIQTTSNLDWGRQVLSDDFIRRARGAISNISIIAMSKTPCRFSDDSNPACSRAWGEPSDYVAATCILYPCVRHYTASIRNGVLTENLAHDIPLRVQKDGDMERLVSSRDPTPWAAMKQPCMVNGTLYTPGDPEEAIVPEEDGVAVLTLGKAFSSMDAYINTTAPAECVASLEAGFVHAMAETIGDQFNVECKLDPRWAKTPSCDPLYTTLKSKPTWYMGAFLRGNATSPATISEAFESMARRITTEMRLAGWGSRLEDKMVVQGDMWETVVCVGVAWGWLALPAAALVSICIVLVSLLFPLEATRGPIWKSSVLPLILKDQPGMVVVELSEMNKVAGRFRVRLLRNAGNELFDVYETTELAK